MVNLTFSQEKEREISSLEARVGSIKRRFKDPLGRRNSVGSRALPTPLRVSDPLVIHLRVMLYNGHVSAANAWYAKLGRLSCNAE